MESFRKGPAAFVIAKVQKGLPAACLGLGLVANRARRVRASGLQRPTEKCTWQREVELCSPLRPPSESSSLLKSVAFSKLVNVAIKWVSAPEQERCQRQITSPERLSLPPGGWAALSPPSLPSPPGWRAGAALPWARGPWLHLAGAVHPASLWAARALVCLRSRLGGLGLCSPAVTAEMETPKHHPLP